ncbi:MAG TPA: biopolymer transporter ExbD [Anaeromyxobacteraceae bacterium]|jgi:biopolymer transport protein ExbD|nr:biopolymer transporter ExbD [Anaeromyxobacteraceae bacterium]
MRRRIHEQEDTGELNIVPYLDIVTNLVMFMLLSMTGLISLGVLNVSAPKLGGDSAALSQGAEQPKLLLTVAISKKGFYIASAGGALDGLEKAVDAAHAPTVPLKADGKYDFDALAEHMKRIKARFPKETNLILSADADIAYEVLVQTMDACRELRGASADGAPDRKLFPDVSLSLLG